MKTALITGAARGIGRAIALELSTDHATAVTYNSTPPDALLAEAPEIYALQADLSDPATPAQVIEAALARLGRLDVIVNNAGAIAMDDTDTGIPPPAGTGQSLCGHDSPWPDGRAARHRECGAVPGLGFGGVYHRRNHHRIGRLQVIAHALRAARHHHR